MINLAVMLTGTDRQITYFRLRQRESESESVSSTGSYSQIMRSFPIYLQHPVYVFTEHIQRQGETLIKIVLSAFSMIKSSPRETLQSSRWVFKYVQISPNKRATKTIKNTDCIIKTNISGKY